MPLTLGNAPEDLTVLLPSGGDFIAQMEMTDPADGSPATFPDGSSVILEIDGHETEATIDENLVTFYIAYATHNAWGGNVLPARLFAVLDGIKELWAKGSAHR